MQRLGKISKKRDAFYGQLTFSKHAKDNKICIDDMRQMEREGFLKTLCAFAICQI